MSDTSWLLLLGSFPGRASLKAGQYYGHPQNQFWRLISGVFATPLATLPYLERLERLDRLGIGLWDVIASADRQGSLDSAIRNPQPSDLHGLLDAFPQLRVIGFNGGTASRQGRKLLGARAGRYRLIDLPSSSPAYTLAFEKKLRAWHALGSKP